MMQKKYFLTLGAFNSGTNFVYDFFVRNQLPPATGQLRTAFFKHYPAAILDWMAGIRSDCGEVEGLHWVVVLRDPVSWLVAMEKARYELNFTDRAGRVVWSLDAINYGMTYQERFREANVPEDVKRQAFVFSNILDVWESLYSGWIEWLERRQYSVSIIRYEDCLESPAECLREVGIAMNRELPNVMQVPLMPSKEHGSPSGYVEARHKWLRSRREGDMGIELNVSEQQRVMSLRRRFGYSECGRP